MRVTLRHLQVFAAVANAQGVTRAGDRIGLSQAATSQSLADLENLLDRRLFDRAGKRLILNGHGRELLPRAIAVLERIGEIEQGGGGRPYFITLGTSVTAGNYILPAMLTRFLLDEPQCSMTVIIRNTEQIVEALSRFEFDIGVVEGPVPSSSLISETLAVEPMVVICAPAHHLANRDASTQDLANEPWVLREPGAGSRQAFDRAIAGHFELTRVRLECGGNELMQAAVTSGVGLGCAVRAGIARALANGELATVGTPFMTLERTLSMVRHREKFVDQHLSLFMARCRELAASHPEKQLG
jgi:DNA-binding transcriptional LysR family regulator